MDEEGNDISSPIVGVTNRNAEINLYARICGGIPVTECTGCKSDCYRRRTGNYLPLHLYGRRYNKYCYDSGTTTTVTVPGGTTTVTVPGATATTGTTGTAGTGTTGTTGNNRHSRNRNY